MVTQKTQAGCTNVKRDGAAVSADVPVNRSFSDGHLIGDFFSHRSFASDQDLFAGLQAGFLNDFGSEYMERRRVSASWPCCHRP
jgi:hypothetical protein